MGLFALWQRRGGLRGGQPVPHQPLWPPVGCSFLCSSKVMQPEEGGFVQPGPQTVFHPKSFFKIRDRKEENTKRLFWGQLLEEWAQGFSFHGPPILSAQTSTLLFKRPPFSWLFQKSAWIQQGSPEWERQAAWPEEPTRCQGNFQSHNATATK